MAASTPPARCGMPATDNPISTPVSAPSKRQLVAFAEMADAKHLAGHLRQAAAKRHVEIVEHHLAEFVGVVSRRHQDRGQHRRKVLWLLAEHLESPVLDRAAGRGRQPLVTRKDLVEPLLQQHRDRLAQPVKQVGGRRVGKEALRVGLEHFLPIPIGARHFVGFGRGARLLRDGVEAETRRQHEALLRATDADVDLPFLVPVVDRAQRRDGVDHQERGVALSVHGRADLTDPAGRPGRGLVVDDHHGLDCMHFVLRELLFNRRGVGAAAPVAGQEIDLDAPALGHVVPERGKMPGLDHQNPVARRQRVDDGGLPGTGAGRRERSRPARRSGRRVCSRPARCGRAPRTRRCGGR